MCIERQNLYPNSIHTENECNNEEEKTLKEWEKYKFSEPFAFAIMTLGILWIAGFIFIKTVSWIKDGK